MVKTKKLQAGNDSKTHAWGLTRANSASSQLLVVNLNGVFSRFFHGIMEFYFSISALAKGIFG